MGTWRIAFLLPIALINACAPEYEDYNMNYKGLSAFKEINAGTDDAFQLQANFEEPGPYSAQFSVSYPDNTEFVYSCVAQVDWKVEGNWVTRLVSVTNGTTISGTSQGVRIMIRDTSVLNIPGSVDSYVASVQIAPGTRPVTTRGPIYQPDLPVHLPGFAVATIALPMNAGITSVMVVAPVNPAPVKLIANLGVAALAFEYQWNVALEREWHPIPSGVWRFQIANLDAAATDFLVIYGIDG
jgi:hypothetical protein